MECVKDALTPRGFKVDGVAGLEAGIPEHLLQVISEMFPDLVLLRAVPVDAFGRRLAFDSPTPKLAPAALPRGAQGRCQRRYRML